MRACTNERCVPRTKLLWIQSTWVLVWVGRGDQELVFHFVVTLVVFRLQLSPRSIPYLLLQRRWHDSLMIVVRGLCVTRSSTLG